MISFFLSLFRFLLMVQDVVSVNLHGHLKKMHILLWCSVLYMPIRSCWLMVLLSSSLSLLIVQLFLLVAEGGDTEVSNIIVDVSISSLSSQFLLHLFWMSVVWCIHNQDCFCLPSGLVHVFTQCPLLSWVIFFALKSTLCDNNITTFLMNIYMVYHFPSFYFQLPVFFSLK